MTGFIDLFIPKEQKFFDELNDQIKNFHTCYQKLSVVCKGKKINKANLEKSLQFVKKKREEQEKITNTIIHHLHQTFITPIDRSEILNLTTSINRLSTCIIKIFRMLSYTYVSTIDPFFLKQLTVIEKISEKLLLIFKNPLAKQNREIVKEILKLENEADNLYGESLKRLFSSRRNPRDIIIKKELYDQAEDTIDYAKHIADIVELILINHS